jgi:hypothetical protein
MSNRIPLSVFAAAGGILLVHDPFAPADFFSFFLCLLRPLYWKATVPALTTQQRARRLALLQNRLE